MDHQLALRKFATEFNVWRCEAMSLGIGLGACKKGQAKARAPSNAQAFPEPQLTDFRLSEETLDFADVKAKRHEGEPSQKSLAPKQASTGMFGGIWKRKVPQSSIEKAHKPKKSKPSPRQGVSRLPSPVTVRGSQSLSHRIMRRTGSLAVDFMTIAFALILSVAFGLSLGGDGFDLGKLLAYLDRFHLLELLAGIYGVFLVYGLAFKLFLGRTLGEYLCLPKRGGAISPKTSPQAAPRGWAVQILPCWKHWEI
jgi:hypothetical protein